MHRKSHGFRHVVFEIQEHTDIQTWSSQYFISYQGSSVILKATFAIWNLSNSQTWRNKAHINYQYVVSVISGVVTVCWSLSVCVSVHTLIMTRVINIKLYRYTTHGSTWDPIAVRLVANCYTLYKHYNWHVNRQHTAQSPCGTKASSRVCFLLFSGCEMPSKMSPDSIWKASSQAT